MWKLLLLVPIAYAAICIALFLAQGRLLFPASMVSDAGPLPTSARRLLVENAGERLLGVHIPPRDEVAGERLLILGFGGNAWNAEAAAVYVHGLFPEADTVAFHYRGYRPSTGSPSAAALLADALIIHDQLREMAKGGKIVAVGFSIGSGVAAHLASRRPIAGAILVTPFDSLRAVASRHYPWLPIRLLFRHEIGAARDLRDAPVPVAIIAAGRDTIIPPGRAAALARAVPNLASKQTITSAGHNDIYDRADFHAAMAEAMRSVLAAPPK